jgi:hypothetical protein
MSAFMCSDAHISALVNAARNYKIDFPRECDDLETKLFALLVAENMKSLEARYGGRQAVMFDAGPHRFVHTPPMPVVNVMKLAQSYDYQSCEHDGWNESTAKKWIDKLMAGLVFELPGYDAAPWSI